MKSDSNLQPYGGKVLTLVEEEEERKEGRILRLAGASVVGAGMAVVLIQAIHFVPLLFPLAGKLVGDFLSNQTVAIFLRFSLQIWILWLPPLLWFIQKRMHFPPTHIMVTDNLLIAVRGSNKTVREHMKKSNTVDCFGQGAKSASPLCTLVARIYLHQVKRLAVETSGKNAAVLRFVLKNGVVERIRLGDYMSQEVREQLRTALAREAPNAVIEPEALRLLEPQPTTSYTELWMSALSAAPARSRVAPLEIGANLREYTIVEQIPSGGQASVYIAKNKDHVQVVLKEYILPIHTTRSEQKAVLKQLEDEAVLLKELRHPQIVELLDFFVEDNRAYMVFEYVQGVSLRKRIDKGSPLSEKETIDLACKMCDVLQFLQTHQPPIVHRDFTPDNLIQKSDGVLKLIDFNTAQAGTTSSASFVAGKRAYMPPEQIRGQAVPQSDIYALGGCIYFLLTGEDPEPLSVIHPRMKVEVSSHIDSVVEKCTAQDVQERYQLATELHSDLRHD